jgi:multisubunit Na+/H+ antiporter MnhE subunit
MLPVNNLTRAAARWLVWWAVLFWVWLLYVGEWNGYEWIAGACGAAIAATAASVVHAQGLLRYRAELRWVRRSRKVLPQVFVDFGILTLALVQTAVRRRPVRGRFFAREFRAGREDPEGRFRRGFVTAAATYSPNAYVLDIDCAEQTALVHDLVPHRPSEEPVG